MPTLKKPTIYCIILSIYNIFVICYPNFFDFLPSQTFLWMIVSLYNWRANALQNCSAFLALLQVQLIYRSSRMKASWKQYRIHSRRRFR